MPLTDEDRTKLAEMAHRDLKKAKTNKAVREVWEDEDYGYLVLGHKILGRLLIGKTVEEALARRGDK